MSKTINHYIEVKCFFSVFKKLFKQYYEKFNSNYKIIYYRQIKKNEIMKNPEKSEKEKKREEIILTEENETSN